MNKTMIAPVILALVVSACAKRPNAISPAIIPTSSYAALSCSELATRLTGEQAKLAALSKSQNKAATADAVGVFLVGVPAASLTGNDNEGDIAVSKGQVLAMEGAIREKGC